MDAGLITADHVMTEFHMALIKNPFGAETLADLVFPVVKKTRKKAKQQEENNNTFAELKAMRDAQKKQNQKPEAKDPK